MIKMIQYEYDKLNKIIHKNPDTIWKIGITHLGDAAKRTSREHAKRNNFKYACFEDDYITYVRWSAWFPNREAAAEKERELLSYFPFKNLWTEVQYNGITECRVFKDSEGEDLKKALTDLYPKSVYEFKKGYWKVYLMKLVKIKPNEIKATPGTLF